MDDTFLAGMKLTFPTLDYEQPLWQAGYRRVAGIDEAGRGAWAGPVSAAAVILPPEPSLLETLDGVRDSKQMTPLARESWAPRIRAAALAWGVGFASAQEIDELGIVPATKLAATRALFSLSTSSLSSPDPLIPDNRSLLPSLDSLPSIPLIPVYLIPDDPIPAPSSPAHSSPAPCSLFSTLSSLSPDYLLTDYLLFPTLDLPQTALVKGDRLSLSVAAASVLAKTARDALMREMDAAHPGYGFARHKGYGTKLHQQAIRAYGLCAIHRRSFSIL